MLETNILYTRCNLSWHLLYALYVVAVELRFYWRPTRGPYSKCTSRKCFDVSPLILYKFLLYCTMSIFVHIHKFISKLPFISKLRIANVTYILIKFQTNSSITYHRLSDRGYPKHSHALIYILRMRVSSIGTHCHTRNILMVGRRAHVHSRRRQTQNWG